MNFSHIYNRLLVRSVILLGLAVGFVSCNSDDNTTNPGSTESTFIITPLVSDTSEYAAPTIDPLLKNAWGLAIGPTGNPWIVNEGTGTSTVYDSNGAKVSLEVMLPAPSGSTSGTAIGTVFNSANDFVIPGGTKSLFLFASPQGTISAWNQGTGTNAVIVASRADAKAAYTGITIGSSGGVNYLYAADFRNANVDVYDKDFNYVRSIHDTSLPSDYYPFNVQAFGNRLFVTYAKKDNADDEDEVEGDGFGFVNEYTGAGEFVRRFASQGTLNAPWGIAIAPSDFGDKSGMVLIGNFGSGNINAYDITSGTYMGKLKGTDGKEIEIEGLWALEFGPLGNKRSTLYYTAGPDDEAHGVFGTITLKK